MQSQNISFGNKQPGPVVSLLGAMKDSAIQVAVPMAIGGTVGAGVGKVASLVPSKITPAQLDHQYADMFTKVIKNNELPEYIKNAGGDVLDIAQKGKSTLNVINDMAENMDQIGKMHNSIAACADDSAAIEYIKKEKDNIQKLLQTKLENADLTVETVIEKLQTKFKNIADKINCKGDDINAMKEQFVKAANGINNPQMSDIAQKGAKHLRKTCIVGAGIAMGAFAALLLNVLKMYGVIGKKAAPKQTPQAQTPQAQNLQTKNQPQ